ncbi:cellulase [Stenotrophomonas terrae]|uniref:Cellulase n=1 Tax=Stenotrophomonas terrae TaxID=405446 RepID=A0A0R0CYA0_9GAMM|nr:cellulase [Stenotrophomonas terrae]
MGSWQHATTRCAGYLRRWLAAAVLLLPALACVPAVHAGTQPEYTWHNVAIGGGGFVTGLVFHPQQAGLQYARTDIGGAYRWDATQQRWQPLLDWMGAEDQGRFGVESMAVDPTDPNRLYLAVGTYLHARGSNGAILRSHDQGRSFQRTELPFELGGNELGRANGERLAVDPNDGKVLLFGTRANGVWRSGDAGASWSELSAFPAIAKSPAATAEGWNGAQAIGVVFIEFEPESKGDTGASRTLYAGVSTQQASLYRSDDAGSSWQVVPGQPTGLRPNHMVRDSLGRWLLSYGDAPGPNTMNNGALWRYDPRDGSWADITPVAQSTDLEGDGFGWGAVAVDPQDPLRIVASTFNRFAPHDDIFRSIDGGRSWTALSTRADFDHSYAPWTEEARPHWIGVLALDPHDPGHLQFVTGYGIWDTRDLRAFDEGKRLRWRFPLVGFEETVPLALVSPPQGAHLISGLGDIDGFVHDDLDLPQRRFAGVRFSNTESLAYAGQAPQLMVRTGYFHHRPEGAVRAAWSNDGGYNWTPFASEPADGEGAGRITVAADGKRVIWQTRNGGHWLSADFGGRWQAVQGLPKNAVVEADRHEAAVYYGFDPASGALYVSGDGGVAFQQAEAGTGAVGDWYRAEIRPNPWRAGEAWVAAGWRGLLHWSPGRLQRVQGLDTVFSVGLGKPAKDGDAPVLFVFGEMAGKRGLYRSDNGGRRWRRIDNDAQRFAGVIRHVTGDARIPGRVYFGTEGRGIWYGEPQ